MSSPVRLPQPINIQSLALPSVPENVFNDCVVSFSAGNFQLYWNNAPNVGWKEQGQLFVRNPGISPPPADALFKLAHAGMGLGLAYKLRAMSDSVKDIYTDGQNFYGNPGNNNTDTSQRALFLGVAVVPGSTSQLNLRLQFNAAKKNKVVEVNISQGVGAVTGATPGAGTQWAMAFTQFGREAWQVMLNDPANKAAAIACCMGAAQPSSSPYFAQAGFPVACSASFNPDSCSLMMQDKCSAVGFGPKGEGKMCTDWCTSNGDQCMQALGVWCAKNPKDAACACVDSPANTAWVAYRNRLCPPDKPCNIAKLTPTCFFPPCYNSIVGSSIVKSPGKCPDNIVNYQQCINQVQADGSKNTIQAENKCQIILAGAGGDDGSMPSWVPAVVGICAGLTAIVVLIMLMTLRKRKRRAKD